MLADGHTPLNAFAGPFPTYLQQTLRHADARRRQREPPSIKRSKCDLEAGTFLENDVLPRNVHISEPNDCVVKRAQSHEPAAIRDLQSGRIYIDDEGSDLLAFFPADHL